MSKHLGTQRYRTLFLSDLHLGTRGCQAHLILDMLRHVEADTIYLVGDIIDGWRLRSGWYWPQAHNDVMQKLLRKVRRGARMVFVPGNHDEFARQFFGLTFGGIEIKRQAIHTAADGKRYLVIHGDEFDVVVRHSKWLAFFGDWAYTTALFVNTHFNAARRALGLPYWSFSAWAKLKVKNAVNFIGSFEKELAGEARRRGVDGVVCGHIHHAVIRDIDGVSLREHGRLRGILLAGGRAFRRPFRGHALAGRTQGSCARGRQAVRGRAGRGQGGSGVTCASSLRPTPGGRKSTASCRPWSG